MYVLCITSEDYSGVDTGRPDATEWKHSIQVSFNSTVIFSELTKTGSQTIGRAFIYPSYTIYNYLHCSEREKAMQKCTHGGLILHLFFSFFSSTLYGVCQNEEGSLKIRSP